MFFIGPKNQKVKLSQVLPASIVESGLSFTHQTRSKDSPWTMKEFRGLDPLGKKPHYVLKDPPF